VVAVVFVAAAVEASVDAALAAGASVCRVALVLAYSSSLPQTFRYRK
jgi:hypothetical protein